MSGNYLSELPVQSSLVILNYSPLQAAQHLTRTSSYQGKPPQSPWEFFKEQQWWRILEL